MKPITVKAVAVWDGIGYLCAVETFGKNGYWCERESAVFAANEDKHAQRVPKDKRNLVDCTISITPRKGKKP